MLKLKGLLFTILVLFTLCGYGQNNKVFIDTLGADSLVQVFHNNGKLFFQVTYKNGKQNGWYEQYHDNGNISHKEFRIDGKTTDGYYVFLDKNGNPYQKGYYKNGVQIGKWYTYTSDGKLFKIYIYNRKGKFTKLKIWNSDKGRYERKNLY